MPDGDDRSLAQLSLMDWIGVVVVVASGLGGVLFPVLVWPIVRQMSEALGTPPSTGASLLRGWAPAIFGLPPLLLVGYALLVPQRLARRRIALVVAFVLTIVESAAFLIAMYATLFTAMGTVQ
jgi:hypothetical protein